MMRRLAPLMILCCVLGLTACGNNDENNDTNNTNNTNNTKMDMTTNDDMSTGDMAKDMAKTDMSQDMAKSDMTQTNDMSDMSTTDMGDDMTTTTDMAQDMAQGDTASLTGKITRSVPPAQGNDAKGNIYIGVFTENPLNGFMPNPNAMLVANTIVTDADLSADGSSVTYRIDGIPPRAEPYYVTPFLDDNGNVDPNNQASAQPDAGDLIDASLMGLAIQFPQVTVDKAEEVEQDFDLKFAIPAFGF